MAKSEESEIMANPQHALEVLQHAQAKLDKALESLPPAIQEITSASVKNESQAADLADNSEIQHVEQQLHTMLAKADAIVAEATRLESESSGGTGSTEASQALSQASAMRGAAKDAQAVIASAPTDTKTGKKRISSAKLEGISTIIARINTEADHETAELGAAITEVRTQNAKRATKPAASKPSVLARVLGVVSGSHASSGGAGQQHGRRNVRDDDDDDAPAFSLFSAKPLPKYVGNGDRQISAEKYRSADDALSRFDAFVAVNIAARVTDKKAAATAAKLYQQTQHGTQEQRDAAFNEMADAVDRHVLGRTFLGQEIDEALAQDAQLKKQYTGWVSSATSSIIAALEANGAITSGYSVLNSYEANRAWSARNVRRIDENADGQLSTQEIKHALHDARATMARANAAYAAKEHPEKKPAHSPKGAMVTLDGFGRMTIEDAKTTLLRNNIKIDKDGNGITYGEAFAAVKQWNATHAPNGHSLTPSASPAHTAPHGPAQRPHK